MSQRAWWLLLLLLLLSFSVGCFVGERSTCLFTVGLSFSKHYAVSGVFTTPHDHTDLHVFTP